MLYKRKEWIVLFASLLIFLLSLPFKGYYCEPPKGGACNEAGLQLFLWGWLGFLYGVNSWFANPFLLLSWGFLILKWYKFSLISGLAASLLAAGFLLYKEVVVSEAPTYASITGYDLGYWLWLTSIFLTLTGTLLCSFFSKQDQKK